VKPNQPGSHGGPSNAQVFTQEEHLNFMDRWPTSEAVMSGVPVSTGNLSSLFVDDPDTVLDDLLNSLGKYDGHES